MSFVTERELEKLRSLVDIVQLIGEKIPLKRSGRNFKGLCPFHNEKTPSFMVHPEKQIYHCFGCGEGGDAFSFLMKYEGIEFPEAVERLAERYGLVLSRDGSAREGEVRKKRGEKELLFRVNRLAMEFFKTLLDGAEGAKGKNYLEGRAIRTAMIREAFLGYAPAGGKALTHRLMELKVPMELPLQLGLVRRGEAGDHYDFFRDRLIFGVVSTEGKVLGFSGRALDDGVQPKYLNSPESPVYHKGDSLLGMHLARQAIRETDQVVLVEGNFDLLRLQQEGLRHAVAPLGTSLTEGQVRVLARSTQNFVLLFDGDEAGLRATNRSLEIFLPLGLAPRVVLLPKGDDPDSFVKREGIEPLRFLISKAPPLLDLRIDGILREEGARPDGQTRGVRRICDLLSLLPGEVEKRLYLQRVAQQTGLSEGLLLGELAPQKRTKKDSNLSSRAADSQRRLSPIERTLLEVLLGGEAKPELLFREIREGDFSEKDLGILWGLLRRDFDQYGAVEAARILNSLTGQEEDGLRRLMTELTVGSSRWRDHGHQAAADCLRQLRLHRFREQLKGLSSEIRKAEMEQDRETMRGLLDQKSQLIQKMNSFH